MEAGVIFDRVIKLAKRDKKLIYASAPKLVLIILAMSIVNRKKANIF